MKKVLVVAYVFPPGAGSAVWRTLKFVKHLPEFGWQPHVITPRSPDHYVFDSSLLRDVPPEARVHHVSELPLGRWFSNATNLFRKNPVPRGIVSFPEGPFSKKRSLPVRFLRALAYTVLYPDATGGWVPFAVLRGVNVVRRHKIDAIYATGTPFSDFFAGYLISLITRRPLILDFRDLWTLHPWVPSKGWISDGLDRLCERRFINRARHVLFTTEGWIPRYQELYPHVPSEKLHFVPHGYDSEDFEDLRPRKDSNRLTISHVGSVHYKSRPDVFLTAVRQLLHRRPELKQQLKIQFIGTGGTIVQEWVDKLDLHQVVELVPYLDHGKCLQHLVDSHLLLMLNPSPANELLAVIPGKTYEYLASGVPILALTPEGSMADLIRDNSAGTVVAMEDVAGIERALESYYDSFIAGRMPQGASPESVLPFQRREATRKLAALLDDVAH